MSGPVFIRHGWPLVLLTLVPGVASPNTPLASPRSIIARAIRAQGGSTAVARLKLTHIKIAGQAPGPDGASIPVVLEDYWHWPNRYRTQSTVTFNGQPFIRTMGIAGDSGWITANGKAQSMPADALKEMQEEIYEESVDKLFPLEKGNQRLLPAGTQVVAGQRCDGVRVTATGRREVVLYFDRATGLLRKRSDHIRDDAGRDTLREVLFDNYKRYGSLKVATKVTAYYDGKMQISGNVTLIEFPRQLDDALFLKP